LNDNPKIPIIERPLSSVFLQLSAELETLCHIVRNIEESVSEKSLVIPNTDPQIVANLQKIDSLLQTAEALAEFTKKMAVEFPFDYSADVGFATESILLSDLKTRLRECGGHAVKAQLQQESCDFFS
jgi:hypothetical protein